MKPNLNTSIWAIASALMLAGCADVNQLSAQAQAKARSLQSGVAPVAVVRQVDSSKPRGRSVDDVDEARAVTINVKNTSLNALMQPLSERLGYGLNAATGVDLTKTVSVDLRNLTLEQALRQVGWQAGYAVVINATDRTVTVAEQATMVFVVPAEDLKKTMSADFQYGSSGSGSAGGAGAAGGTGGAAGGASGGVGGVGAGGSAAPTGASLNPVASSFVVKGSFAAGSIEGFRQFVQGQAGSNARVEVFAEAGLVSVRGNGQALKRVHDVLQKYSYQQRRQIEVNARLIDVSLSDEFAYGIQWDKVLNAAGTNSIGLNTLASAGAASTSSLSFTSASITSVIKALQTYAQVHVVSSPKLIISHGSAEVFFKGDLRPYLPSVTATTIPSGTGTATSQSGSGAYATEGVNIAVYASILDDDNAVLTVVPSVVSLGNLNSFLNNQIQMFDQTVQNSGQRISVRDGQTVVISGTRTSSSTNTRSGVPGLQEVPGLGAIFAGNAISTSGTESVLIINARILKPAPMNIVFSESI
jgi:MSHA biogenesis protein MshL